MYAIRSYYASELDEKHTDCKKQIKELQENFSNTKSDFDKKIAIAQKNVNDAQSKIKYYDNLQKENLKGIDAILDFVAKEPIFETEKT